MSIEELKKLKKQVEENLNKEEKMCQEGSDEDYVPLKDGAIWSNKKKVLIEDSLMGNNVLIIGSEAVLNKESFPKTRGDTELMLLHCLQKKYKKHYVYAETLSDMVNWANLGTDIKELLREQQLKWKENALNMLDPSLRLMLESKCFRLIITTTFDPILEYALQKIWNGELCVKNLLDELKEERDICRERNRKSEFYDITPTLFYAFGKAKEGVASKYALSDDGKVYAIAEWLGANKPKELLQYIENKSLMAIGCNFENWVFRFLWYILNQTPTFSSYIQSEKRGSVAIRLTTDEYVIQKTKDFFDEKDISYFDNSRLFMSMLAPELIPEIVPQVGDIFISYASEDFPTALKLYKYLKSQRQSVWFDIRLKCGDRYGDYIIKGINQCDIFMPILSNQTKVDIKALLEKRHKDKRYYMKEWDLAQEKAEESLEKNPPEMFIVMPVVIEDYSVSDGAYHNTEMIPNCIYGATVHYTSKESASFDNLLKTINEQKEEWKRHHPNH